MDEPVLKEEATPVCNRFLIFTSGATPADLLVTSMGSSRCERRSLDPLLQVTIQEKSPRTVL